MIPVLPLRPGVDKQPEVAAAEVEAEAELDVAGNTLIPTCKYILKINKAEVCNEIQLRGGNYSPI